MVGPSELARAALAAFETAFNAADIEGVRATCNYPHVALSGDRTSIAATPADLTIDFDALISSQGWHHTSFDDVEEVDVAPTTVGLRFSYTRYTADGAAYFTGRAIYVFTDHDGHWGRQLQILF